MDCQLANELYSERLEGYASPRLGAAHDTHLLGCLACRRGYERFERSTALLTGYHEEAADDGTVQAILAAVGVSPASLPTGETPVPMATTLASTRSPWGGTLRVAAGLAAGVLVGIGASFFLIQGPEGERLHLDPSLYGTGDSLAALGQGDRLPVPAGERLVLDRNAKGGWSVSTEEAPVPEPVVIEREVPVIETHTRVSYVDRVVPYVWTREVQVPVRETVVEEVEVPVLVERPDGDVALAGMLLAVGLSGVEASLTAEAELVAAAQAATTLDESVNEALALEEAGAVAAVETEVAADGNGPVAAARQPSAVRFRERDGEVGLKTTGPLGRVIPGLIGSLDDADPRKAVLAQQRLVKHRQQLESGWTPSQGVAPGTPTASSAIRGVLGIGAVAQDLNSSKAWKSWWNSAKGEFGEVTLR